MIDPKIVANWQHALSTTLTPTGISTWEQKLALMLEVYQATGAPPRSIVKLANQLDSIREAIRPAAI